MRTNMGVIGILTFLAAVVCAQSETPEGYVTNRADGKSYKLVYQAKTWYNAQKLCEQEGSVLAVPKTQAEFDFIQKVVRGMYYPNVTDTNYLLLVWLGINNLEDYRVWKNVFGEDINSTAFHTFAGNEVSFSDNPKEPHCGGIDAANPGYRVFWCAHRQPYLCQRHYLGDT